MRKERLLETAASTRFVNTPSLNCVHQARIDSAEISARGSSFVTAALNSPVSVLFVVG